jgi:hypothetical protein
MDNVLNDAQAHELMDTAHFGIELKEVDFTEFERRKAPRKNNYLSFIATLESPVVEVELSE